MAALTVLSMDQDGLDVSTISNADTGSGDTFANAGGDVFLLLHNNGATGQAVATIAKQGSDPSPAGYGKLAKASEVITLETGERFLAGPFAPLQFNDASGLVNISYSGAGAADVDVAAIKSPNLAAKY